MPKRYTPHGGKKRKKRALVPPASATRFAASARPAPSMVAPSVQPGVAAARPARVAPSVPQDYRYVISDLKRIGILAGGLCVILVILAFVLP